MPSEPKEAAIHLHRLFLAYLHVSATMPERARRGSRQLGPGCVRGLHQVGGTGFPEKGRGLSCQPSKTSKHQTDSCDSSSTMVVARKNMPVVLACWVFPGVCPGVLMSDWRQQPAWETAIRLPVAISRATMHMAGREPESVACSWSPSHLARVHLGRCPRLTHRAAGARS
jgi:hypothetical protein